MKVLSLVTIMSLVLPSLSVSVGFALPHEGSDFPMNAITNSSLEEIPSDDYLGIKTYFRHLVANSPYNDLGSCGFVSLVQYLSYYDSYMNDTVISENFDVESVGYSIKQMGAVSPGVKTVKFTKSNATKKEKTQFVKDNKDNDFQYSLMYHYNTEILKKKTTDTFEFSIGMWDYQKLFDSYWRKGKYEFKYISADQYSWELTSDKMQSYMLNFALNKLLKDEPEPVILHLITAEGKGYHSVVAYLYESNDLYCNFGWGYGSTYIKLSDTDYYIKEVGYADLVGYDHYHSTNYLYGARPYCGCGYSDPLM